MSQLQETNQTLDFFCDFNKIAANVDNIKLSLCMLNSLIGTTDLRKSVETIWNRDRTAFSVMDILIAVRSEGKKAVLNSAGQCIILDRLFTSIDGVMEYLEGEDLAHRLKKSGKMSWEELSPHIWRVLCALNSLHAKDLIHRDISPDNIFLLNDGGTKLIDFGSVRNYADGSEKSTILKHKFAPFEQYQRRGNQGPWTDIYALSVTMYYSLTGHLPANAPDRMIEDRTPPLQQAAPNVPLYVSEAIFRGMAPRIENRFPTVEAFAAALFPGKRLESTVKRVEQPTHSVERGGARLFCTQGALKGGSVTLYPGQIVSIGRAPECTISYAQFNPKQIPGVSRRQCSISMNEQGQLFAQDNGSSYGTLVNQRTLPQGQWVQISRGSVIQFGYQLFCIQ